MLSKIIENKTSVKKEFPKLMMADNGIVVLFKNPSSGVCVKDGEVLNQLGDYSNNWDTKRFQDFEGTIELSNDVPGTHSGEAIYKSLGIEFKFENNSKAGYGFPKLMKHNQYKLIVLFENENSGTVLYISTEGFPGLPQNFVPEFLENHSEWDIEQFSEYNHTVTLYGK